MEIFSPKEIYIDQSVWDLSTTRRILDKFPQTKKTIVQDRSEIKFPQNHTHAKQQLFLTRFQGEALRSCQGIGDYVCCNYHTFALVSDCHLECTYCILQDYLKNNPIITVYTNIDDIFNEIKVKLSKQPDKFFRVGTGELSDSLALDPITDFSKDLIRFAANQSNMILELKTKTNNIENLIGIDHRGHTIISWSLNPQKYINTEEYKCSSLEERLTAAKQCSQAGYPIAFHFDPLLYLDDWKKEYISVIDRLADEFFPSNIAWISLGTLRFTPNLKKIVKERFPKSKIMSAELYPGQDGKVRYFKPIREEMYQALSQVIISRFKQVPLYLCMETKSVWNKVFGYYHKENNDLDKNLSLNIPFAV